MCSVISCIHAYQNVKAEIVIGKDFLRIYMNTKDESLSLSFNAMQAKVLGEAIVNAVGHVAISNGGGCINGDMKVKFTMDEENLERAEKLELKLKSAV